MCILSPHSSSRITITVESYIKKEMIYSGYRARVGKKNQENKLTRIPFIAYFLSIYISSYGKMAYAGD